MIPSTTRIVDISTPCRKWPDTAESSATERGTTTIYRPAPAEVEALPALNTGKLNPYFGLSVVLDLTKHRKQEIGSDDLLKVILPVEQTIPNGIIPQRVLLRTGYRPRALDSGAPDYPYLSSDALMLLSSKAVLLVGIDTPSIEQPRAERPLNEAFMRSRNMVWLVNVDLENVRPNRAYMLSALPLIPEREGEAPTRAVLIQIMPDEEDEEN